MEKSESLENLIQFVVDSVQAAPADDAPFHHLRFDRIFPDDFYAADGRSDAGGRGLPGDVRQKQDGQQQGRWKTHSREDRSFPGIHPPFTAEKTRSLGCHRSRAAFQGVAIAFVQRLAPGLKGRFGENFAKREHVSGTDPDARHSRIPYLQTYRQPLERDHRSILSAARTIPRHTSARFSTRCCLMDANRRRHRCRFRRIQVTPSP